MGGEESEYLVRWHLDGYSGVRRRVPVGLRDREAFVALLAKFADYQDHASFMIVVNGEPLGSQLPIGDLIERLPRRVESLHLQSVAADYIVRLDGSRGGETLVDAPVRLSGETYASPLRSLTSIIETNRMRLGLRRHLWRIRWLGKVGCRSAVVVELSTRAEQDRRRHEVRKGLGLALLGLLETALLTAFFRHMGW